MQPTSTNPHPIVFFGTLLTNAVTAAISLSAYIEPALRIMLLALSCWLTLRQLLRKPPKAPGNHRYLNLAGGFLLLCLIFCGCAAVDHTLLTPDGAPKPAVTNLIAGLQSANTATAPFDPYAPIVGTVIGLLSSGVGWYAHIRSKNQHLDAQTQTIAALHEVARRVPKVSKSSLP